MVCNGAEKLRLIYDKLVDRYYQTYESHFTSLTITTFVTYLDGGLNLTYLPRWIF